MWWAVKGTKEEEEKVVTTRLLQLAPWDHGAFADVAEKKLSCIMRGWEDRGIKLSPVLQSNGIEAALGNLRALFVGAEALKAQYGLLSSGSTPPVGDKDEVGAVHYSVDMGGMLTSI